MDRYDTQQPVTETDLAREQRGVRRGSAAGVLLVAGTAIFFIPAAVGLFALGRLAFLIGYRKGAAGRSFGMAVTAVPTIIAYAWAMFLVVRRLLA